MNKVRVNERSRTVGRVGENDLSISRKHMYMFVRVMTMQNDDESGRGRRERERGRSNTNGEKIERRARVCAFISF
jgi:hypothetical protein